MQTNDKHLPKLKCILTFFLLFCFSIFYSNIFAQQGINHQILNELLRKYVDDNGMVNYKEILSKREVLNSYLEILKNNPPTDKWTKDEELAYWINAYNAFTIDLVLDHYPIKSIKDIGSIIQVPFVNSPWDIKFINIKGKKYDLNNIEHGIIRKKFEDPRIHFALVCAAISCPKLQNQAYLPKTLDNQLTDAGKDFLSDKTKNEIHSSAEASLSKLFNWYGGDFTKRSGLALYLNQFIIATPKLIRGAKISYKDYDWSLNEQK